MPLRAKDVSAKKEKGWCEFLCHFMAGFTRDRKIKIPINLR